MLPKFSGYVEAEAHYIFHPSTIWVRPLFTELGPKPHPPPPKKADFAMKQTNICRLSGDINDSRLPCRNQPGHHAMHITVLLRVRSAATPKLDSVFLQLTPSHSYKLRNKQRSGARCETGDTKTPHKGHYCADRRLTAMHLVGRSFVHSGNRNCTSRRRRCS